MLPLTPAAQFAAIIDLLCRMVAARIGSGGLAGPLIVLICSRLRRMAARFAALDARLRASTLPAATLTRRRTARRRYPRNPRARSIAPTPPPSR